MDEDDALAELPFAHATALRMDRRGLGPDVIAEVLAIAPESVGPLLDVGRAKLARVRTGAEDHPASSPAPG